MKLHFVFFALSAFALSTTASAAKCPNGYTTSKGCVDQCSSSTGFPYYLSEGKRCVTKKECLNKGYVLDESQGFCEKPNKCTKNQYLADGKCRTCPQNATCNGKTGQCKTGYIATYGNSDELFTCELASCKKNQYLTGGKCYPCPPKGTCNGKLSGVTCSKGYEAVADGSGKITCDKVQPKFPPATPGNGAITKPAAMLARQQQKVAPTAPKKHKTCKQGSHVSIATIKKHYKNCTNCETQKIKAGTCTKDPKAHVHYYCDCDC